MIRDWDGPGDPIDHFDSFGWCSDEDDLFLRSDLKILEGFDWHAYRRNNEGEKRSLLVAWNGKVQTVVFDADEHIPEFLAKMPTLDVVIIQSEPDAGPGSGPGYAFFPNHDFSREEVRASIVALRKALDADHAVTS